MSSFGSVALARLLTAVFAVSLVLVVLWLRPGCVRLTIWASFEKSDLLASIADGYERLRPSEDLRCVVIDVVRKASGEAEDELSRLRPGAGAGPDVWSPAAATWVSLLERHRALAGAPPIVPSSSASILNSPLVIAMPEPMARALGWPSADISWRDIFALAQDDRGWASRGHPEWGRFKLAKTNPLISTSGLHALLATHAMAGGGPIEDPKVAAFMRGVESSVVHYGSTVSAFLLNLAEADDRDEALTYVSAIAMEEKQVWDYNRGNPEFRPRATRLPPKIKLVAIYPAEGTLLADHPYVVLLDAGDQERRAAARFLDYLKSDAVQQQFLGGAFRGARREVGEPIRQSPELNAFKPSILFALPDTALLQQVASSWTGFRKRARVLLVMDAGASMGERVGPASKTKLDLVRDAWLAALDEFAPDDEVGLWTIAGAERRQLVPIAPLREQRLLIVSELSGVAPDKTGRSLYAAVSEGVAAVRQKLAHDRINAVVVLTDGANDDAMNNDLNGLLRNLRAQPEDERVRVFTIAYGPAADVDALDKIAHASRGASSEATDPGVINRLLLEVMSNF